MNWPMMLLAMSLAFTSFARADAPASQPAPEKHTFLNGQIEYFTLADWHYSAKNDRQDAAALSHLDHKGLIQIQVLPPDAADDQTMIGPIVRQIRELRKKSGAKVIQDAKLIQDKRFEIKVVEKYEINGNTQTQSHVYRQVGKRILMMNVIAVDADDDLTKLILKGGDDTLASAKWNKK